MKNMKKVLALVLALAMALALTACSNKDNGANTGDNGNAGSEVTDNGSKNNGGDAAFTTVESGKLHMSTNAAFPPYEMIAADGSFEGIDIEVADAIAKKLGLSYKFQPMDFNGIIPGLQTGNVDVGIAGMTITPERAKVVQFSNGYYTSGLKILVRDDEKGISKVEDLAGKVVAVKTGTSSVPFMKDFGKAKELKQFPNNDGMFFELLSKGVDAVVFDMPVVTAFANSAGKGKAKVVGPLYEGQKYGIGFAQGNEELVKKVNGVLDQMRKDGSYAKLYEKWFGFAPKESDM